jgi:hypothetical protein
MPVANLASLPQPAELITCGVTGVDDVGVAAGAGDDAAVEGLLAPVLPPQATSVMRSNAAHACLMILLQGLKVIIYAGQ